MAEKMNRYLGEHWRSFASQNYFDRSGVFISVIWSGPLIFISIASVVSKNLPVLM
jgi:transmembrane protein 18